jgi:hypothetical protein
MKLGKEEIQKLTLGILMLIGVIYSYFDMLLFPELKKQDAIRKNIASLTPEIAKAKEQIKRTQDLEKTAPEKTQVVPQVESMIPDGAPVAWFPPRVGDLFKREGIDKVAAKMNTETPEKELPGFRRLAWTIDFPKVDFVSYGRALCALENDEPLIEVTSLSLEPSPEDVESQHALITVNNLVKQ